MQTSPISFARRAAHAIDDDALQEALQRARDGIVAKSDMAMSHPSYEVWRDQGAQIRDHCLANLGNLMESFEQNATKAGSVVHFASNAKRACQIIARIAAENGNPSTIKSKSMLSEEIGLNQHLADAGVGVLETDLGEYIIQLDKGRPSHIIAPVFHMRMQEISELFAAAHDKPHKHTPAELVAEARQILRPQMLAAGIGITGANFLLADSGSSVIVTNEGNGRFCNSIPKVRITIAGIEKLIPSAAELAVMLRLLPRAATGQDTSAYVTIATGTSESGPSQHHIVLIDNGRSSMLASKYRSMLRCIRCGACMNHCPVYLSAGGLSYNSTYPGPMGAVLSPQLFGRAHDELPHAATMCGACNSACPVRIPLTDLMRQLREDQTDTGRTGFAEKAALAFWLFFAKRPSLYRLAEKCAGAVLRGLAGKNGRISSLPGISGWFAWRDLKPPVSPQHDAFAQSTQQKDSKQ